MLLQSYEFRGYSDLILFFLCLLGPEYRNYRGCGGMFNVLFNVVVPLECSVKFPGFEVLIRYLVHVGCELRGGDAG